MELWADIIDKPNLREILRAEFPYFGTFVIATSQWAYIQPGYPQEVYDYLTANCITTATDPTVGSPTSGLGLPIDLTIGSIPSGTVEGQLGFSVAHGETFSWNAHAGAAGEWWSTQNEISWGGRGNIGNGGPFRVVSYLATTLNRGYPVRSKTRAISITGKCLDNETGILDIRCNGVSRFQVPLNNQNAVNETFDVTDSDHVITMAGGSPIAANAEANVLQFYWINSTTGSIRDPQFRMRVVNILAPGD